ncbi:MAG: 4'-phosphopantetheinyl transferase superfamily protein [Pyrinomonadaceae bacterium]|nr:4'-phosphopantetheinyl transferase superfamily protein [Pyrinomonadaceae bacterium]
MAVFSKWSNPPDELQLEHDAIHVWQASLDCDIGTVQRLEASLAPDEKSRAARYAFKRDRDHFIAARGILRTILGAYMHRTVNDLHFTYGPEGKPSLQSIRGEPSIRFNLSHSHSLAVYAFSNCREVGIDVEAIRSDIAESDIAERVFSPRELAELQALAPELQNTGFFLGWTRKEAYIKARGSGMGIPLDSFDVSLTPGQPEVLCSADSSRWKVLSIQPAPGYVGAVVGEGTDWGLRLWDLKKLKQRQ